MPFTNANVGDNKFPPVASSYHWIVVPVATKLATVALLQKVWFPLPVGVGVGVVMVTVICVRWLSQIRVACEA